MTEQIREQLQQTLGSAYVLERELGGGGMSRVFLAEETALRRKVVVKVLPPELTAGVNVDRFNREIRTAAALQQANIVPVLSTGETQGLPFYTMPYVEGESLRARAGRGPFTVTETIGILRDVSKALAYAHARGVVHRDIKPDNVLLSGGTAVVTDFGIAKAISASRTEAEGATLTQIGTSIGTPAYMAPEQAAGDPGVDHRADLYSLGCMAYELLAGQAVFAGRTPQRMLAAHMAEAPKPLSELRSDIPRPLAELVMACLAKDASARPQQATDIVRVLDSITSGSGMQAMPPVLLGGAVMFRKALLVYALAFGAVAILAKAAIVGIGLPDWVFPGSLIVMALGLPVVLWTGYVQRVTRQAMTTTPTFTPGGTPAMVQGTLATMALKAAPRVSWDRTARGGVYALGTFVVMIAVFMAMRALGIGPFASLIASGSFKARDRVIITDFRVSNADSSLGRVVGDAIRAGLIDSRVFTLVTPSEVSGALQRMQRPGAAQLDLELARQMAMREGVKAIVDGDVTQVGASYIVAVRLVTADSARELMSFRGTANGPDAIIEVADDLSRKLRAKAGESLRRVQATPALAYASTSSLDALRKYSEGMRANDVERDYIRAVRLLREAVSLDPDFAEGWRKLAVAYNNSGGFPPSAADSAIQRAFALRDRMTERERDAMLAYYYSTDAGADRAQAIATYERMLARGDSAVALVNVGTLYRRRQDFARAEAVTRAAIKFAPGTQAGYNNLILILRDQGKLEQVDSVIREAIQRFPASTSFRAVEVEEMRNRWQVAEVREKLDSALKVADPRNPAGSTFLAAGLAFDQGRLREQEALNAKARALNVAAGRAPVPQVFIANGLLQRDRSLGLPIEARVREFDRQVAALRLDSMPPVDRPYLTYVIANALIGRAEQAKQWLARYEAEVKDPAIVRRDRSTTLYARSVIARAERRWSEAVALLQDASRLPDGPVDECAYCVPRELMDLHFEAGNRDSALAAFAAYRALPTVAAYGDVPDRELGGARTEALARAFDAKGDVPNAVLHYRNFIELWKDADAELQPRVAAARARLRELTPTEGTPQR